LKNHNVYYFHLVQIHKHYDNESRQLINKRQNIMTYKEVSKVKLLIFGSTHDKTFIVL